MEWFWAITGGVVAAFLVFGAIYDRRANRRGRQQLQPKEPSREQLDNYNDGGP
jgi:hypothetical protein